MARAAAAKNANKRKLDAPVTPAKRAKPTTAPETLKSPSQPKELSEADRSELRAWLDEREKPFQIAIHKSKKRKRDNAVQVQDDLFEDRLSVQYEVVPVKFQKTKSNTGNPWEYLKRFKKFTVGDQSIATGEFVLVKPPDDPEDGFLDVTAQWKAKVLEIRALDSEHVYIRVAWLNRPEDLDSGRKAYHGRNELIPSNQMDIIDAMSVNGRVEVRHWDERDEESESHDEEVFFWRQTFDYANTKTFSELRKICVDETPQNPDEMILQCGSKECGRWQHVRCIAERALPDAAGKTPSKKANKTKKPLPPKKSTDPSTLATAERNNFLAELYIAGEPASKPATKTQVVITTPAGEKIVQEASCLFCGAMIEST